MAVKLGLPALLGLAGQRDLALALVISRVIAPASKLSTRTWWDDVTLGADLGVEQASTDDIYAASWTWLAGLEDAIEAALGRRHLAPAANPARMALFDLSSSWLEGTHCPLAALATPATARKAPCRSSTGCSPTLRAGPSRSGCSPATPATRPRSPRSSRCRGARSGWRRWSWSGTGA